MAKPQVAVIILNWNGLADTLECLESVLKSKTKTIDLQTILVDNGSTDKSVSTLKNRYGDQIKLLENSRNLGFSGGNNVGIRAALESGTTHVILLNNDTTVAPDTFQNLFTSAQKHGFDLASPKIYFYPGCEFHHDQYQKSERGKVIWYAGGRIDWANVIAAQIGVNEVDLGQHDQACETEFATGCCLLIDKKVIDKIDLLPTIYTAYWEDTDYCLQAQKAGFKIGYTPDAHLWHKNAGSSGGSGSTKQIKLAGKSRLIFALRHAPLRAKLALIKHKILGHTYY